MEFGAVVIAYLFPGQGSQVPAMRHEVARLRPGLLAAVCEIVGEDPFERIAESTRFAQPAILCASLARWSALDARPDALLGHSLGELAALTAAGALSEQTALELVAERGRLMAQAGSPQDGMLVVLGGDVADAAALAREHGVTVANDNAPGQVVLSGRRDALLEASRAARAAGLRAMRLPVAGAFHSPAMAPAREAWEAALAAVDFAEPKVRVVSCQTALPIDDPRAVLADSLTHPVRFREALLALHAAGCERFVDVGPGRILEGLVRRTLPRAALEPVHA
jgi:[acyl-carrier-protein] S-malonyltransferase